MKSFEQARIITTSTTTAFLMVDGKTVGSIVYSENVEGLGSLFVAANDELRELGFRATSHWKGLEIGIAEVDQIEFVSSMRLHSRATKGA